MHLLIPSQSEHNMIHSNSMLELRCFRLLDPCRVFCDGIIVPDHQLSFTRKSLMVILPECGDGVVALEGPLLMQ